MSGIKNSKQPVQSPQMKTKKAGIIWAAVAGLCLVCLFQLESRSQSPTPLLQGSAKYSENSRALDPLLWPGNMLDKDAARALLRDSTLERAIWAPIPDWEAGDWASNQAVNTKAIKYMNGQPYEVKPLGPHTSIGKFNKGYLKDARGTIWHLFNSDYWTETQLGNSTLVSYVVFCSPGGGEFPDFYAESVDFEVVKPAYQILRVRRAKSWTRYTDLGNGMLKEETVRTNFDENGHAAATSFNTALAKRTAPFSSYAASFAANKNIVKNFHDYLHAHKLDSLIPASK